MINDIVLVIKKKNGHRLECLVDSSDLSRLLQLGKRWSADWSKSAKTYYVYHRDSNGKKIYLHRWLMDAPATLQIDHKDHDGLNNRRCNLRIVTQSLNNFNNRTPRTNTSGFRGVTWNKNRALWQAQVKVNTKLHNLGCFATKEQAHIVVSQYRQEVLGVNE